MIRFVISLLIAFFYSTLLIAQDDIYIPYRSGKVWGIANYGGNMVIAPQYDSTNFMDSYDYTYIKTFKANGQGLVINGKEALGNYYHTIILVENKYIIAVDTAGTTAFDMEGTAIINKPAMDISHYFLYANDTSYAIFHVFKDNGKEDLAVWNANTKQLHYLFKDYASIKINKQNKYGLSLDELRLVYKKKDSDLLKEENYTIANYSLEKIVPTSKGEMMEEVTDRDYDNYGAGVIGIAKEDAIAGGPPAKEHTTNKNPIYLLADYLKENDELILKISQYKNGEKIIIKQQKITLPKHTNSFTIERLNQSIFAKTNEDTSLIYNQCIFFTTTTQKGFWVVDRAPVYYDYIQAVAYTPTNTYNTEKVYILGKKDAKSKKMQYGLLNAKLDTSLPLSLDTIIINNYTSSEKNYWIVMQNNKYGIVQPDGKMLAAPIYDNIQLIQTKYNNHNFWEISNNGKYGFLYTQYNDKVIFIQPVFEYNIQSIYPQFPINEKYHIDIFSNTKKKNIPSKLIILLKDKHNKILGFANEAGKLYFNN